MVLEFPAVGHARRYQVRTTSAVQVGEMAFENEWLYVVEQRVLARNAHGCVLQFDVLHAVQKADDVFSRVTADVNQAMRRLVLQTDPRGQLLRVENQPEVAREWARVRPAVRAKYAAEPAVRPFLEAFEQQLAVPGSLEPSLRDKGLHAALLPGVFGQPYAPQTPVLSTRRIAGFFHDIDLPLVVATTAGPVPASPSAPAGTVQVTATATLDEDAFAVVDFRRLVRGIVDDYTFPVDLGLDCQAQHLFDAHTGTLVRSQQRMTAEVAGAYRNSITHEIFPQPAP